jgi:hypothetical protein
LFYAPPAVDLYYIFVPSSPLITLFHGLDERLFAAPRFSQFDYAGNGV